MMERLLIICLFLVALSACNDGNQFPLSKVVQEPVSPPFVLDPTQPFQFEIGHGSGWDGLDTTKIDGSGLVSVHRMRFQNQAGVRTYHFETTSFQLTQQELDQFIALVIDHKLMALERQYHADVHDGYQSVLLIEQHGRTKSVYCNNYFPSRFVRFSDALTQLIGLQHRSMQWTVVPESQGRDHEKSLWGGI